MIFRDRIQERIKALGTNPNAVSAKVGRGRTLVAEIINGKSKDPGIEKICEVARALETSVAYLIGETDDLAPGAPLLSSSEPKEFLVDDLDVDVVPSGGVILHLQASGETVRYALPEKQHAHLHYLLDPAVLKHRAQEEEQSHSIASVASS